MLLLKCCCLSWPAFVDSTFPEHLSGRFAKFIPSPVWSSLAEYIFYVEVVVESASRRPFPALYVWCPMREAKPDPPTHLDLTTPPTTSCLSLYAPCDVPGRCSPDEHPASRSITRKSSQLRITAAMWNAPTLGTLGVLLGFL